MNYVNIYTHKIVGRNNNTLTKKLSIDMVNQNTISFQFIDSNNQILDIDTTNIYLAGTRKLNKTSTLNLFFSDTFTYDSSTKTITFTVDTYTQNYLNQIKNPNTDAYLEIGKKNVSTIYCFDVVACQPRGYISGLPPAELDSYYTKTQSDARFATLSGFNELSGIVSGDIANLANNYWTKTQTASAIAAAGHIKIKVVQQLPPVQQGEQNVIYLVPHTPNTNDIYDEWLKINNQWQKIGSTATDLTQYLRKDQNGVISGSLEVLSGITSPSAIFNTLTVNTTVNGSLKGGEDQGGILYEYTNLNFNKASLKLGYYANANGYFSLALGDGCTANGQSSLAQGTTCTANGQYSHAEGYHTQTAQNEEAQHVEGRYNIPSAGFQKIVGGGSSWSDPKNIYTLDWNGNEWLSGSVTASSGNFDYINEIPTSGIIHKGDNQLNLQKIYFYDQYATNPFIKIEGLHNTDSSKGTINGSNHIRIGGYNANCEVVLNAEGNFITVGAVRINGQLKYKNNLPNTAGGFCINDSNGNLTVPSSVISKGMKIETLSSTSFTPSEGILYNYTLSGSDSITFNNIPTNTAMTWQLYLAQPSASVGQPLFTNTIKWGDAGIFNSTNTQPTLSGASTKYRLVFQWDGEDILGNLAFKKEN